MKRTFRFIGIGVTITLLAGLFSGCATYNNFIDGFFGDGEQEDTIRIALYEPFTGVYSDEAKAEINGVELANKLFPTVLGKRVELVRADNGSDLNTAKSALEDLVNRKPAMVLGSYGSAFSMLAGDYFLEAGIPALTISNTNPLVNADNPYYFRVCFVEAYQGRILADFTVNGLGLSRAAVIQPQKDDYATTLSAAYSGRMTDLTGSAGAVVSYQEYKAGATDFSQQLEKIKSAGITAVFFAGGNADALRIITQAKSKNMSLTFLGTESWNQKEFLVPALAAGLDNFYFPTAYDSSNAKTEMAGIFLAAYQKEYGVNTPPERAALGFDAYLIALDAIARAGDPSDSGKILQALNATVDFQGASGIIRFDAQGDPERSVTINGIVDKAVAPVYTVEPAAR